MHHLPTLLCLQTCYDDTHVLLLGADGHLLSKRANQQRKQAQHILILIDDLLSEAQIQRDELDGIAYFRGPGSFTGIRIGAAVVEAISFALNLPVLGLSSLHMLAYQAYRQGLSERITAVINAHMQEVYCASYSLQAGQLQTHTPVANLSYEAFLAGYDNAFLPVGNGLLLPELAKLNGVADIKLSDEHLAHYLHTAFVQGEFSTMSEQQPDYIRPATAWKTLSEQSKLIEN